MVHQRKRRKEEEEEEELDRISNLVDDLLSSIVSHLPVRDAVRTSTLSRRWRFIWTNPLRIVFRRQEEEAAAASGSVLPGPFSLGLLASNTLINHSGTPLRNCRITDHPSCSDDGVVAEWFRRLGDPPVQVLSFYCLRGPSSCHYPPHAFSHFAHTLQELELTSCNLPDEPPFHGCVALRVLSLQFVHLSDETFTKIVEICCPLLESLILSVCEKLSNPHVSSSNLKRLEMRNMKLKSIQIDTPALTTLTSLLYMGSRPFQMQPFPLLRRLCINIDLMNVEQSMRLASFLQECSLLQEVTIKPGWGSSERGNCWESMRRSEEKLGAIHLETVILEGFTDNCVTRSFLVFVLFAATGLKRVDIWYPAPVYSGLKKYIARLSVKFNCEINLRNKSYSYLPVNLSKLFHESILSPAIISQLDVFTFGVVMLEFLYSTLD